MLCLLAAAAVRVDQIGASAAQNAKWRDREGAINAKSRETEGVAWIISLAAVPGAANSIAPGAAAAAPDNPLSLASTGQQRLTCGSPDDVRRCREVGQATTSTVPY